MANNSKLLALTLFCVATVFSNNAHSEALEGSIGQLDDLQQKILIAQKKQELSKLQQSGTEFSTATGAVRVAQSSSADVEPALPGVMSVMGGAARSLMAILDYGNGQTVNVRVGTSIPGGYRVESIGVEEVVLSKDDKRHRLAVGVPLSALSKPVGSATPSPSVGYAFPPSFGR